ncbi:MAG TPA: adenosine kinase [Acidimicrobiales bacterium]|nr:adenosine kinase [Acidimicrobiales bacterium]
MGAHRYDVVGLGNAIVDVIANVDDDFLADHGLQKGGMTLIDTDRATSLYNDMPPGIETSGGSVANSMAGIASFGARAAYIGKVRDDQLGEVFRHDIRAAGVAYDTPDAASGPPTARCLIQVTPDAQRTMNTYLGIAALLEPADVDQALVAASRVVYCEGYLWDVDVAKQAIRFAMDVAKQAGNKVALTLSDSFCVERHRAEWLDLIHDRVDILFANEAEIHALYGETFDGSTLEVARHVEVACLTRSARGSRVVTGDGVIEVPPHPIDKLVDTTGAGDLYAAGFLYGYTAGYDLATCGALASLAASEVITHIGARPVTPLRKLAPSLLPSGSPRSGG